MSLDTGKESILCGSLGQDVIEAIECMCPVMQVSSGPTPLYDVIEHLWKVFVGLCVDSLEKRLDLRRLRSGAMRTKWACKVSGFARRLL